MPRLRPFRPADLTAILERTVSGLPGTIGVYVTDLMSGRSAGLNPTAEFYAASTIKVPIAMAVLRLVDQGRLSLDQTIAYQPEDYQAGTGVLQATIRPGDRVSVRRLLELMITVSDNIARNMLERFIGSGTIRNYMLSLGVAPAYDPLETPVTPAGMTQVLIALDSGRSGLSRDSTRMLLRWMEEAAFRQRIPRYLPESVVAATKIGSRDDEFHDVGLVYAPDRSFAISVFTKGLSQSQAEEVIGRIAEAVYWYEDSLTRPA
ncbi:serine hydrolase [Symbiobacterium terraclitae]|uniref:serine hydrolase n=1 Tax=Symbiobacterium terraclitae TaxID=557451 RepID=UPI0035B50B90